MDVSQLPSTIEYLLRPFSGEAKGLGELAQQLDYLGNVVIVLAVLGT